MSAGRREVDLLSPMPLRPASVMTAEFEVGWLKFEVG